MDGDKVTLEQRGSWLFLWTPKDRDAFERELERRIPAEGRQWDEVAGAWRVHVAFTDFALALAESCFPGAFGMGDDAATEAELSHAFAELHLAATAPPEVVEAACRALAALYRGYDSADAQLERVTTACEVIRRHHARRDREALHKHASTPWPDDG